MAKINMKTFTQFVTELSKKTLERYSDKASKDIDKRFPAAETDADKDKIVKRLRGYARATNRARAMKD